MRGVFPPRYSLPAPAARGGSIYVPDPDLPPYSSRSPRSQARTEHIFQLTTSKNKPWATLKVLSSASSSRHLPTFQQDESINGSLALSLEKSDSILSVSLSIRGRVITGASDTDTFTFFEHLVVLWSKSSEESQSGKLNGNYLWPYAISLPDSVAPPGASSDPQRFSLPQTFSEKHTRATIQYELTVQITRGKLRSNSYLRTGFAYIPLIKPGSLSFLRQLAYKQNLPLLGPDGDPEGWKTFPPVTIRGSVQQCRNVVLFCTLSLAKPLCYTRGSVIPCILEIRCDDRLALDLFSSQTAAVVRLQRRVRYSTSQNGRGQHWKEEVDDSQSAVWWPSEGNQLTRRMSGEIQLEKDLQPSTCIPHFNIAYSVVMRPLEAPTFVPSDSRPLIVEPVDIVTAYARGPRPRALCPPGYERPTQEWVVDPGSCSYGPFTFMGHP